MKLKKKINENTQNVKLTQINENKCNLKQLNKERKIEKAKSLQ